MLRGAVRADGVRHRRDHGRAGARPARLRVRARSTICRSAWSSSPRTETLDADHDDRGVRRRGRHGEPGPFDGEPTPASIAKVAAWLGGRGPRASRGQLPAARLADQPPAVLGRADPDRALSDVRRGRGARRRAAGRCCPTTSTSSRAGSRRWRVTPRGSTSRARRAAARPRATPTRWTRSSTRAGTSSGTARPATRTGRSGARTSTGGCRSASTPVGSSTRSCTCCTRGSSRRCSTTWGWSGSPSRSRG